MRLRFETWSDSQLRNHALEINERNKSRKLSEAECPDGACHPVIHYTTMFLQGTRAPLSPVKIPPILRLWPSNPAPAIAFPYISLVALLFLCNAIAQPPPPTRFTFLTSRPRPHVLETTGILRHLGHPSARTDSLSTIKTTAQRSGAPSSLLLSLCVSVCVLFEWVRSCMCFTAI